ncbi:unnamed protein product [Bemisia tabaci]|uniref:Ig-like domain-containing protein n=1 Tax=Bemisia tabaci TaxID=7038 RepID=A0A9P0EVT3_BEMTA|nr:unnamed protein product [Bemisia tabaci]
MRRPAPDGRVYHESHAVAEPPPVRGWTALQCVLPTRRFEGAGMGISRRDWKLGTDFRGAGSRDTPSFGISRIPGFGTPLTVGIPVSLKCDVDSNPPSTPVWQKEAAVTQLLGGHGHLRDPINSTYVRNQRRVETIVGNYEEYKQQNNVRTYLRAIANNLKQRADETRTDSEGGDD